MRKLLLLFLLISTLGSCQKSGGTTAKADPPISNPAFAKGADISWLTQMEASGIKFYNRTGVAQDCMVLLKSIGLNAIRLRVWVNPTDGWCNTADVVAKAVRANDLGMKLMIDFHYSDVWADPGHQTKPAFWVNQDITALQTLVYDHTLAVLNALKAKGITPVWVQVGNETNDGMLWEEGRASKNMNNFALLINAGYNAVKAVNTNIKVIVHISNGYDNSLYRWIFDGLQNNGAKWDVIGMSLYPDATNWSTLNAQCLVNMNDMVSRYNKEVMISEVGMSWSDAITSKAFLTDIISKTRSIPNNKGLGVFYWEPEAYNNWQGYSLGAFDNSGKPTAALDAFN